VFINDFPPCIANGTLDEDCKGILSIKKAEAKCPNAKMIITKRKTQAATCLPFSLAAEK